MTPEPDNAHRDNARLHKAMRLANWIEANLLAEQQGDALEQTLGALSKMPALWWKGVAGNAGVHKPSKETQQMVAEMLRDRHEAKQSRRSPLEGLGNGYEGMPKLKGCSG